MMDNRMKNNSQWLEKFSDGIISHMNEDHANSIVSSLNAIYKIEDQKAKMHKLELDGYYILSRNKKYFIKFNKVCENMKDYKEELIKLAKKYRKFEL
tara:strand:- start:40 stop:330 length:291 start_codon:yes stop_codon:yes gene_type:complete